MYVHFYSIYLFLVLVIALDTVNNFCPVSAFWLSRCSMTSRSRTPSPSSRDSSNLPASEKYRVFRNRSGAPQPDAASTIGSIDKGYLWLKNVKSNQARLQGDPVRQGKKALESKRNFPHGECVAFTVDEHGTYVTLHNYRCFPLVKAPGCIVYVRRLLHWKEERQLWMAYHDEKTALRKISPPLIRLICSFLDGTLGILEATALRASDLQTKAAADRS